MWKKPWVNFRTLPSCDDPNALGREIIRSRSAGAYEVGNAIIPVAEIRLVRWVVPEFGAGIVGQNPGTAGVDPLGNDGKAGLEVGTIECALSYDLARPLFEPTG